MNELRSYVRYLDGRIGCSNDYYGMFEEGYEVDEIVEIVMNSLQELYNDSEDAEVIEWMEGLNDIFASLEV